MAETEATGRSPWERTASNSAGVSVATQGRRPSRLASSRARVAAGTAFVGRLAVISARRVLMRGPKGLGLGVGGFSGSRTAPSQPSMKPDSDSLSAARVVGRLLRLGPQLREPLRGRQAASVEHDATHDHRHAGAQASADQFQRVAAVPKIDADAGGAGRAGRRSRGSPGRSRDRASLPSNRRAKARRLPSASALKRRSQAACVSKSAWVTVRGARRWRAGSRPACPSTSRSRMAVSLASRSRSPAATSRSMSITSCIVAIASSATCASTSRLRWSPAQAARRRWWRRHARPWTPAA